MNLSKINDILVQAKMKLESLDPARIEEAQNKPEEHSAARMAAAKRRLENLYGKLTKNRPPSTKVQAYGTKR